MDQFKTIHRHCYKLRHEISNMAFRAICREPMEKGPRGEILRTSTHGEGEVCVPAYTNVGSSCEVFRLFRVI